MTLIRWTPPLPHPRRRALQMDRLFDSFLATRSPSTFGTIAPPVDIEERRAFVLTADLPGADPKQIRSR